MVQQESRLNAADNSAFETKGLYTEFLSQKDDFKKTSLCLEANKPKYDFFAREILRNLESMEELRTTIDEAIGVLRSSIKASSHSSKEIENDDR